MPAQTRIGANFAKLTRQCHGKVTVDKTGKATCRETYEIGYEFALKSAPGLGSPHPLFRALVATSVDIEETEGNMASIPVVYEGLYQNPVTLYERDTESTEEPIETHKDFEIWAADPANAVVFVPAGKPRTEQRFSHFGKGPLQGEDKYLVPKITWTSTTVSNNRQGGGEPVGKVNAPDGPAPSLQGAENWILFSVTETDEGGGLSAVGGAGGCYRYKKTWHASGGGKAAQPLVYGT